MYLARIRLEVSSALSEGIAATGHLGGLRWCRQVERDKGDNWESERKENGQKESREAHVKLRSAWSRLLNADGRRLQLHMAVPFELLSRQQ